MKLIYLTTTGRKTGKPRRVELYAFEHEGQLVVTASKGGSDSHPAWFLNLRATPGVTVHLGQKKYPAVAKVASPALRKKLWAKLIKQSPHYAQMQKKTKRVVPMVLLQPQKVK